MPQIVEYATNTFSTTQSYTEGDVITYTCTNNNTIMVDISCDGAGNWETPSDLECPACKCEVTSYQEKKTFIK